MFRNVQQYWADHDVHNPSFAKTFSEELFNGTILTLKQNYCLTLLLKKELTSSLRTRNTSKEKSHFLDTIPYFGTKFLLNGYFAYLN